MATEAALQPGDVSSGGLYAPPHPLQYPFGWQMRVLQPGADPHGAALRCMPPFLDPGLW